MSTPAVAPTTSRGSDEGINGAALTVAVQSLHDKWEANGLATATLIEIADTVFSITVT